MTQSAGNHSASATETGAVGSQTPETNGGALGMVQRNDRAFELATMALSVLGLTTLGAAMM